MHTTNLYTRTQYFHMTVLETDRFNLASTLFPSLSCCCWQSNNRMCDLIYLVIWYNTYCKHQHILKAFSEWSAMQFVISQLAQVGGWCSNNATCTWAQLRSMQVPMCKLHVVAASRSNLQLRRWMLVPTPPDLQQLALVVFFLVALVHILHVLHAYIETCTSCVVAVQKSKIIKHTK